MNASKITEKYAKNVSLYSNGVKAKKTNIEWTNKQFNKKEEMRKTSFALGK